MSELQGTGNSRQSRKPLEGFVVWNEPRAAQRQAKRVASPSHSIDRGKRKAQSIPSSPLLEIESEVLLSSEETARLKASGKSMTKGVAQRQLTVSTRKSTSGGEAPSVQRPLPRQSARAESGIREENSTSPYSTGAKRNTHGGEELPLKNLPTNTVRVALAHEDFRYVGGQSPVPQTKAVMQQTSNARRGQPSSIRRVENISSCAISHAQKSSHGPWRMQRPLDMPEAEEELGDHEGNFGEDSAEMEDELEMNLPVNVHRIGDDVLLDSDEYEEEADSIAQNDEEDATRTRGRMEVHELTWGDESARRKERRQLQSMQEKERDMRRRQGRPRHFLMVDEYTRKPYGVGVGDWRKELMLLSRDLDPAINNINKQLQGAVEQIAEWIQHTWEYSAPIRFECVKEVVARGVNLRRSELFKKIRNKEPKPEGFNDRSWRILKKQLSSPATARKSEACSRANAMRVNFGRTSPSGEVGVRERLRRKLRRSPDPEEIQFEMARDKGYGGRSQSKDDLSVMHGSESGLQRSVQQNNVRAWSGNASKSSCSRENVGGHPDNEVQNMNLELHSEEESAEDVAGRPSLIDEQILHHPLVRKMMQRLEALEGQQSVPHEEREDASPDNKITTILLEEFPGRGGQESGVNVQNGRQVEECHGRGKYEEAPKSGRRKSRAMQIA